MPSAKSRKGRGAGAALRRMQVRSAGGNYPVLIGGGALGQLSVLLKDKLRPSRLHLVSDRNVLRHHGARIRKELRRSGIPWSETVLARARGRRTWSRCSGFFAPPYEPAATGAPV